ncbi:MAG: hypothetical protein NC337_14700 [Roseburia sp.]|nr:hypothetical protein [Roseburia sp.]
MAMRITTKMMQNTSLRNLNTNKSRQEKLVNQMTTGKKISRPSDDPIIAIRALKLNSTLDKIEQYYEKNSKDAENWINLTASAISTVSDMLSNDIRTCINQAVSNYQKQEDRQATLAKVTNTIKEFYATGNAESGGRSIFTGYRTDLPLTFMEDKIETYSITEQVTNGSISKMTFVNTGDLKEINEGNFNNKDLGGNYTQLTTEYDVATHDIYRIRLAYGDTEVAAYKLDENGQKIPQKNAQPVFELDADGNPTTTPVYETNVDGSPAYVLGADGNPTTNPPTMRQLYDSYEYEPNVTLTFKDRAGLTVTYSINREYELDASGNPVQETDAGGNAVFEADGITPKYKTGTKDIIPFDSATNEAYQYAVDHPEAMVYIASTGELLLGADVKEQLSVQPSSTEFRISYEKSNWAEGDLDPIHYFYVERTEPATGRTLKYNENYLDDTLAPDDRQIIEYDIGNHQTIRVNTTPDELFDHDLGRDAEELVRMMEEYAVLDDNSIAVKKLIDSGKYQDNDLKKLEEQYKALEKAKTMISDKITTRHGEMLTECDKYMKQTTLAETNCASRGSRLELIQNRLNVQKTSFEELVSSNEDVDYADLTIQLKSVEMTYQAALSSISYVLQTTLLDFIR